MTLCTIEQAMDRIRVATQESPVAVFTTEQAHRVDVVFADTVHTRNRMDIDRRRLVGVFDQTMELGRARANIRASVSGTRPRLKTGPEALRCPAGAVRLTPRSQTDPMME